MSPVRSRRLFETVETRALILGRVPVGDADLLLQLLTEERGLLSVSARSARRARSAFGVLEPIHTLFVRLALSEGRDVANLRESRVDRSRLPILDDEQRLNSALELLRLVRTAVQPGARDPGLFSVVEAALELLAEAEDVRRALLFSSFRVIGELGYSLELSACVRCGKVCGSDSASLLDPSRGGLVCRACGGGPIFLSASERRHTLALLESADVNVEPSLMDKLFDALDTLAKGYLSTNRR